MNVLICTQLINFYKMLVKKKMLHVTFKLSQKYYINRPEPIDNSFYLLQAK